MGAEQEFTSAEDELKALEAELLLLERMRSAHPADPRARAIAPVSRAGPLPLSFAQQRLWFLNQLLPGNAAYHIFNAVQLSGRFSLTTLQRCFAAIIQRHEVLRTTFADGADAPVLVIAPRRALALPVLDLRRIAGADQPRLVQRLATAAAQRPFDLVAGPLIRATLLRLGAQEHLLLLSLHHAVADGWSLGVLIRELTALYTSMANGQPDPLPDLPIQYADYAVWQRNWLQGEVVAAQLEYWQRQLAGAPTVLDLPTDRPRPPIQTLTGATAAFALPADRHAALQRISRAAETTLFTTLLAAFSVLLYRYSGQDDIVVGTPIANRTRAEIEPLIGFFVNTLALRTDLSGDPRFLELAARVHATTTGAFGHADLPFDTLVERLHPPRDLSRSPLFQVMFVLNVPAAEVRTPGLRLRLIEVENGRAQFDLTLFVSETPHGLAGSLEYNTALFDAATMRRLAGHYGRLLEAISAAPTQRISALALLTVAERQQILVEWNDTAAALPLDRCFPQLFETQAERTPDAVAAGYGDAQLSYGQLNQRANLLAAQLAERGSGPEALAALLADRDLSFLIAMLAVFKAGSAYLPLDPRAPAPRLRQALQQSRSGWVLCADDYLPALSEALAGMADARPQVLPLAPLPRSEARADAAPPRGSPRNLAYVIYTSGSTGTPKGAMLEQRGMVNHLYAKIRDLGLVGADIVAQTASQSFDISVWQYLAPLLVGGRVQIYHDQLAFDPTRLLEQAERDRVTILETVPSLLRAMLEWQAHSGRGRARRSPLRWLMATGEALAPDLAREWQRAYPDTPLINAYGPTECSDDVAHEPLARLSAAEEARIPIGRPVANTQLYVLDARLRPAPIGVVGELYVGGAGVGRGYLHEPAKTALAFIPNPFAAVGGLQSAVSSRKPAADRRLLTADCRLYKTGDLACWRAEGKLAYLGRTDHQVKVRGFRIELGEIEAALAQHPGVREAVVVARTDAPGDTRLVAYIVQGSGVRDPGSADQKPELLPPNPPSLIPVVRAFLAERLPDYMLPSAFVTLDELPLTPHGKLDRAALPAPEGARPELQTTYISPHSEAERTIAAIWKEALHVEQVGVNDNFFDLGGHSLLVAQIHRRLITAFGKEFPLTDMFRHTTVAALAQHLGQAEQRSADRPAGPRAAPVRPQAADRDVAIIGMVGRFPGSDDLDQFWANLRDGVESISFFSAEQLLEAGVDPRLLRQPNYVRANTRIADSDRFDARFFGINPREAEVMDPQQRLFLEYAWHAIEHAGYDPSRYDQRIGVYAGQTVSGYLLNNLYPNQGRAGAPSVFQVFLSNNADYLATQVAYRLNLKGPAFSVQTACSTSLVAVHLACRALVDGECEMALAGGVSLRTPEVAGYLHEPGGILSPDGHCRPFDAAAQGTLSGSGVGVVVLKSLARALADGDTIHAVIKGSAINNDGARKIGFTAPSEDGQVEVIRQALDLAGVAPATLSYIEAHGTGTALGDPIEVAALTRVFRSGTQAKAVCGIGSVKGNIGHPDAASGIAGLLKAVLALKHKQIPPSINFSAPNPNIDFANSPFYVNAELREWRASAGQPRRAGVSSFGIGGTNAHAILEEAPPLPATDQGRGEHLLILSAQTEEALEQATARLADHLRRHPAANLADVAYTLQVGRCPFTHRRILACADAADAAAALEARDPQRLFSASEQPRHPSLVFMFPGQGAQYLNMGRGLYEREPDFRRALDRCAELLAPHLGLDLRDLLYPAEGRGPKDEGRRTNAAGGSTHSSDDSIKSAGGSTNSSSDSIKSAGGLTNSSSDSIKSAGDSTKSSSDSIKSAGGSTKSSSDSIKSAGGSTKSSSDSTNSSDDSIKSAGDSTNSSGDSTTLAGDRIGSAHGAARADQQPAKPETGAATDLLDQTWLTQPALFAVEYALAQLWLAWGLRPQALIGHSIGEYVAATLAGVFSLEDALDLVALRGRLIQQLPPGSMLSVPLAEAEIGAYLDDGLALAAVNGPRLCVVSGADAAIEALRARLEAQAIDCRRLNASHAFHSAMIEPILEEFTAAVRRAALHPPRIPFVSNVTGTWITAREATDPQYWARHMRQTVRFADGVQTLLAGENPVLLEVGPGRTLSSLAKQQARAAFASLRHPQDLQTDRAVLLTTLGRLWLSGLEVDWRGFYGDERRRRTPLPGYAFARERYWVDPQRSDAPSDALEKRPNTAEWLYTSYWKPDVAPLATAEPSSWALFGDGDGLAAQLAARLRAKGHAVAIVQAQAAGADPQTLAIVPHEPQEYARILAALGPAPQQIVYCATDPFDFYGLLFLAQEIVRRNLTRVSLSVVTRSAQQVADGDMVDPAQAMVLGPALVIPQEYPDLACRSIDVAAPAHDWQAAQVYDALLAELLAQPGDPVVAYRGGRRWVQSFQPIKPPDAAPHGLREGGVYMITGGLGRIGRTLARYLAQTVRARMVLTGRAALPPRDEWAERLARADAGDAIGERIRFVQNLERQGCEVLVVAADVADREQMRAAITATQRRFGALHGVLHTAGVVDNDAVSIPETTRAVCETQFRPKVHGTLALAEALEGQPLDFCILFSSLAAVLGGLGFAAYAAANRFMDAFAQQRNQLQPTRWISVNWDGWLFPEDGAPRAGFGMSIAELAMSPEEGVQVFERALRAGRTSPVIVSTGDLPARFDRWVKRQAARPDAEDAGAVAARHIRPHLQNAYVAPRNQIEKEVADIWQQLLGIAEVGVYDNFFELGGHSLLATQVISRIRNLFGVQLPIRRLIESPCVADLALAIAEEQLGEATAKDAQSLEALLAEVEGLSDDALHQLLAE